jgi:hypothetical protein
MSDLPTFHVEQEFQGGFTTPRTRTDLLVHHAAALYPSRDGIADVRSVAKYHLSKGWSGIGYHIALAEEIEGGRIARYFLSDLNVQRAHIAWRNHEFLGVSCLTNFDKHQDRVPGQKWFDALVVTLADLLDIYPSAQIFGHKEKALDAARSPDHTSYLTACPGARWADWKEHLISEVQALVNSRRQPADLWAKWGDKYPLSVEQRTWGIPQQWITNANWLGEARSFEMWSPDGLSCVQWFQGGYISFEKLSGQAHLHHRTVLVP